jgi:hypothetical protein
MFGVNIYLCFLPTLTMVRLRTYARVLASPGGRSFYSTPRKRTRRPRAPITPALKETLTKQWESRRKQYASALKGARGLVRVYATQLRETFGGHSVDYYTQEILQCGQLERGSRKPSRWNMFVRQQLQARNAGMVVFLICSYHGIDHCPQNYPLGC